MKVKTFILSLLLTMFCSTSFGQHWGEIPNHYEGNMTFVTQIFIDDVLQGEDIEIGAFCGDEFRGSARPIASQDNLVYLLIEGDGDHNGDQISFKLARHYANAPSEELDYVIFNALTYEHNARIGASPADLVNGLLPEDHRDRTEFNSVARLNGEVYPSLANALAACKTGNNTIELLKDNAEDVTIKQVEGVNITIDGGDNTRYDYSGTITIHGNARYQGAETLTFTNIDFTTNEAGHYFIDSNKTGSVERYAHNVTVDDCNFTATGAGVNSAVAMRIRQGFDIAINGGTFTGLHSVLQAYGNAGINITGIISNCKNGISVGSSTNVVITGSDITATGATGYGVRAGDSDSDGVTVNGPFTITDSNIEAFIPVVVRGVNDDTDCVFNFTDDNTMTASNNDGYWCVIGKSEYEANGSLPETAGKIIVNATEADLLGVYGYSRVEVTFADSTTKYFYMMEDAVPYNNADNYEGATIKLLSNCAGRGLRFWENDMTFDLNGKKYTINQAVGSSGTESQGFQIRPEVTGNVTIKNGTIDIKAGTNVKWMFNSYAADFVVQNVTIDGTNMVTNTSEDYLLVVQNAGDQATFDNVTINNYPAKKVYLEGNTTFVTPQQFDNSIVIPDGYVLEYENGAYIVKAGNVWNETKDKKYATLAEAIAAATAGDKLFLLADITENVTVNKNLTIDGANAEAVGGKFDYTGTMTANAGLTVTVQNIDFVGGGFDKSTKSTSGNYTIKNCTFEDDGDYPYPVRFKGASSVTIEDCTVKNYLYSFLYITSGTNKVSVKNVTVEDCSNYAVYFASGVNTATIENLTVKNSDNGIVIDNTANRALTLINCKLENVLNAINHSKGTNTITCTLLGNENDFGTSASSQYAKYVLAAADATLTAPEGYTVTTTVENSLVKYVDGAYKVVPAVAKIGDVCYETLAGAVEAATAGQTVELIADAIGAGLKINKNVTIDFGGFKYTINQAVGSTGTESQGFQLLKNNTVTLKNGNIAIAENTNVKWMFNAYADVTLENLNVNCANMAAPAENEANYVLVVNNGGSATPTVTYTNVTVTNFPSTATAQIWLDPTTTLKAGAGLESSIETGEGYVVVYNNGEYTAVPAVASITADDNTTTYYETLAGAVEAATSGQTVNLLKAATGAGLKINKNVTIDFGGFTYTINQAVGSTGTESQGFQLLKNNTVTLKNGNIAIAENTNVKWMFNAYADVTLENLNVNCANMAAPAENEANYVLVVNNGGSATPTVNYSGVNVTNFPSTNQIWLDPTTTLKAGAGLEDSIETEEGYVVVYNNGEYTAIAGNVLNVNTGVKYATLAEAIAAADAGNTIKLLADITENVTVDKKLTIDGAGHNSTGLISTNKNVTYTFKNFNIDGANSYFVKVTGGGGNYVFDNCNIKNSWGLIYTNKSTNTVSVKNSIVDNCEYGVAHFTALNSATLENVTVQNSARGLMVQNQAAKTIKFVGCNISATEPVYIWDKGTYTYIITLNFEGENTFDGELGVSTTTYGKLVLTTADATLTAPEGLNVTTSVAGHIVDYADGKYYLRVPNYVAAIGETKYESLQEAIDAAVDNDEIVVIDNIEVTIDDLAGLQLVGTKYPSYYVVRGKTISIDLNGKTINANVTATDMLLGLFSTEQSGNLTLKDSSNGNGKVEIVATDDADVYSLITNYDSSSAITIDGGNYILNKVGDSGQSLIYDSPGNMVVNGGNFYLGNLGLGVGNVNVNGIPWIFNVKGQNDGHVTVNGGTFNADVNHQHWAYEVYVPNTLALKDNGNNTWTVVPAVAQGTDSWKGYNRSLGYASIADAAHWATAETTVTVVADHEITETAIVQSNITLDFAGKEVTCSVNPAIRIQGNVNVTVKNGNMNTEGYNFILGASDGSSAGNLTIESGTFHGTTTVASVTKGNLNITGGEFSVEPYQGNYAFLINCIDANYNNGDATVSISGGTFHNWNPENNAAEGANTNFCAQGYGAVENPTDVWTVVPKQTAEVKDGWNWFSYYVEGNVLNQLQSSLGAAGVQIKSRTQYTQYSNGEWNGSLQSTTPAESYKINVDADAVINVTGSNIVDPSKCYIMLNNGDNNGGWNWIGYPLAQETSVATAFAGVVKNGDQVKTRTGFAEFVNGQWWGHLMTLKPGVGYMYFRAGANETVSNFTYPTPSSKEAVQPNITADANLWVPNSTSYANNMTMVAVLNMNGEMMNDNYEVAAMVDGEVRGSARPIYVEPMDAYMLFLTIHGEGVEEVTFQCYDFNTDTEYVLNNTINYSDDARLGSVNEPYVLCYGTMGIGENAMNTINIYPNPTTTGREINLGATCDKVEVYNALGVKVAEYQDVDTLDAIETAGIYVIRVTNDGDVKHCRLVVK